MKAPTRYESPLASITRQPLPSVMSHVVVQIALNRESTLTHCTLEGIDAFVDVKMPPKAKGRTQILPTDGTGVKRSSGVSNARESQNLISGYR